MEGKGWKMRLGMPSGVIQISFLKYDKETAMVKVAADQVLTGYTQFHMDETEFRRLAIKMAYKGYAFIDKTESYDRNEDNIDWFKVTDFENWGR